MKLEAWLRQEHSLVERLRVVERLSQAVNEVHDGGTALAALEPARIEVSTDGRCDLAAARRGSPGETYLAPERDADAAPTIEADIYAAGAIAWEVLAGRPCGRPPTHLAQARPELPRELADAVMGCLESSPEWRPKDLTYLAQLALTHQGSSRRAAEPEQRSAPARRAAKPPTRGAGARSSRSHWPLFLAAALVLVAAAGSYTWIERRGSTGAPAAPPVLPSSTPPPVAAPSAPAPDMSPATAPLPARTESAAASTPAPPAPMLAPTSAPTLPPPPRETTAPVPANPVAATPTPAPPPIAPVTLAPAAGATPAPVAPPTPTAAPTPAQAPAEPPVLSTLSPLQAQRPGRVLFDLHGSGFHPALHVRVLPIREAPRGIVVLGQKWVDATLVKVLLELGSDTKPGVYAITLEDAQGQQAKPLTFTVTR
jgi:hypothetical protein